MKITCNQCGGVDTTDCEYVIKRGWNTVKQCLRCNPAYAKQHDIALRAADLPAAKLPTLELRLSSEDVANILDALAEWYDVCEPKELAEDDVGLDDERYGALVATLAWALAQSKEGVAL